MPANELLLPLQNDERFEKALREGCGALVADMNTQRSWLYRNFMQRDRNQDIDALCSFCQQHRQDKTEFKTFLGLLKDKVVHVSDGYFRSDRGEFITQLATSIDETLERAQKQKHKPARAERQQAKEQRQAEVAQQRQLAQHNAPNPLGEHLLRAQQEEKTQQKLSRQSSNRRHR